MLFSIIVPVHNAHATLGRCVQSVVQQAFSDWELFLVENGSSDNSLALCEAFAAKHQRIHALQSTTGPSEARNIGIKAAQGEYLIFLDADDQFCGSLERLAAGMTGSADIYMFGCDYFYLDGRIEPTFYTLDPNRLSGVDGPTAYRYLFGELRVPGGPWHYAFRREMILSGKLLFPQDFSLGEDLCFVSLAVWRTQLFQLVPESLIRVTRNEGDSLSTQITLNSFKAVWKMVCFGLRASGSLSSENTELFLFPYRSSVLWLMCEARKLPKEEPLPDKNTFRKLAFFLCKGKALRHAVPGYICMLLGRRRAPQVLLFLQKRKGT